MLTPSVNVVQSSFPDEQQGEISGLSRSVSNLGSSLGTAVAGTILIAGLVDWSYGLAMTALAVTGVVGLMSRTAPPRQPHAGSCCRRLTHVTSSQRPATLISSCRRTRPTGSRSTTDTIPRRR